MIRHPGHRAPPVPAGVSVSPDRDNTKNPLAAHGGAF